MRTTRKATTARRAGMESEKIEVSTGNVFADLGFEDSEERLLKAKLASKIAQLIDEKGWTQAQTAPAPLWINPRCRVSCAANFLDFLPIIYSPY